MSYGKQLCTDYVIKTDNSVRSALFRQLGDHLYRTTGSFNDYAVLLYMIQP